MSNTTIGIIGTGNIGKALAGHLAKAGYPLILSNRHGGDSLNDFAKGLGSNVQIGSPAEAAQQDIVILALPWAQLPTTLPGLTDWKNKIVVDATNHFVSVSPEFIVADLGDKTSSEVVRELMPGVKLVKAFNTLPYVILGEDPAEKGGKRVIFFSGDAADAKKTMKEVISHMGFFPVDLGGLAAGGRIQQAKGPLASLNLLKL